MIQYCKLCLMPSTRPRIVFKDGVCNACSFAKEKQEIDWDARKKEFLEVIEQYRGSGPYDCVVPFSGGKDSAAIAWRLKHEFGLNPLLACYGQLIWTGVGRRNLDRVCADGFDILYWRGSQRVSSHLARRFFIERGCPKIHYNAGVNAVPLRTAINFKIPLVFYAEHGESEYGGLVLDPESRRTRNLTEVLEHQIGDDPRNWAIDGISENELTPYIYPEADDIERVGVKAFYFSYFFPWDVYENAELVREKMRFGQAQNWSRVLCEDRPDGSRLCWTDNVQKLSPWTSPEWWGKSDGSFEGFDSIDDKIDDIDFFMMDCKFSFGRSTRMASRLIQGGHLSREDGLRLVRQYDGETPKSYFKDCLQYLGMTEKDFWETVDLHRNPELWQKTKDGWLRKYKPG